MREMLIFVVVLICYQKNNLMKRCYLLLFVSFCFMLLASSSCKPDEDPNDVWVTGAIAGLFSVSSSTQVYFSQGNLQYIGSASTPYWKFADHQWDYLGDNGQGSSSQNVDRDLFGWSTSGWNNGNTYYRPWDTDNSDGSLYGPRSLYGPPGEYNLTGQYANSDWGVFNPISNGGDQIGQWRTLTRDEWIYVFNTRSTASGIRYAKARVNNVNGVILVPDNWSSSTYTLNSTNSSGASYSNNPITQSAWENTLEPAGCVFLPAAGSRGGTSVYGVGSVGYFWSSSCYLSNIAYGVCFRDSYLDPGYDYGRYCGFSVRLVHDCE